MPSNAQFIIRLGVNSTGVTAGISSASSQFDKLSRRVLGLFAAGSVANIFQKIVARASDVSDTAKKWQASTTFVQEFGFAAKQTNVDVTELEASFRNTRKAQVEALQGGKEQLEAFKGLHISLAQLKSLRPEQLFRLVAENASKLPPSVRLTADLLTVLGQKNDSVAAAFQNGFLNIANAAKAAGQVIDDSVIKKLSDVGDRISALGSKMIVALAPGVSKLVEMADTVFDFVNQFAGGIGTVLGTLAGGGDLDTAMREAANFVKEEARKQAEEASKPKPKDNPPPLPAGNDIKPEKKKEAIKDESFGADSVGSQAQRGIFVGGRAGEITRIPQQTLEETRGINRRIDKLIELQHEAVRTGNSYLPHLRDIYNEGREDA